MTSTAVDGPETGTVPEPAPAQPPTERWSTVVLVACVVTVVALIGGTLLLAPDSDDDGDGDVTTDAGSGDETSTEEGSGAPAAEADDGDSADAAAGDDAAADDAVAADGHHHDESTASLDELAPATRAEVDRVIAEWATKYPTAADATAAGWFKATPSLYGIGAHFIHDAQGFSVAQPFDLMNPNILLYDGEGPDARFAGVSYVVADEPEGFAGDYDSWHAHSSVCMGGGGITLTEDDSEYWYSEAECTEAGGRVMPIAADEMMHLWIGPGYDEAPIFAHDNPELYDGYYPKRDS